MRAFTRGVYLVFGALALVSALGALVRPTLILGRDAYSPLTAHLIREQAAGFVFIGLMCFWCLRHYDARRPVHLGLVVFTAIFAGIHWADYLQSYRHLLSPVVNTVPVAILGITIPTRSRP